MLSCGSASCAATSTWGWDRRHRLPRMGNVSAQCERRYDPRGGTEAPINAAEEASPSSVPRPLRVPSFPLGGMSSHALCRVGTPRSTKACASLETRKAEPNGWASVVFGMREARGWRGRAVGSVCSGEAGRKEAVRSCFCPASHRPRNGEEGVVSLEGGALLFG